MPTTILDASLSTYRRRNLALFTWRTADNYPAGPLQSIRPEQANGNGFRQSGPSALIPLDARLGAQLTGQLQAQPNTECQCNGLVTLQGYVKNSPASCGGPGNC